MENIDPIRITKEQKAQLKWLSQFVSTDNTRPALLYIYPFETKFLVAGDGYTLAKIPIPESPANRLLEYCQEVLAFKILGFIANPDWLLAERFDFDRADDGRKDQHNKIAMGFTDILKNFDSDEYNLIGAASDQFLGRLKNIHGLATLGSPVRIYIKDKAQPILFESEQTQVIIMPMHIGS